MNERRLLMLAAMLLALAVLTGAFGAHGLKTVVLPAQLAVWQTAVLYHFMHALGLLAIVACTPRMGGLSASRRLRLTVWCLLLGLVFFSGSLYLQVLTNRPWLGAITPIGGTLLIVGWLLLAWTAWRHVPKNG